MTATWSPSHFCYRKQRWGQERGSSHGSSLCLSDGKGHLLLAYIWSLGWGSFWDRRKLSEGIWEKEESSRNVQTLFPPEPFSLAPFSSLLPSPSPPGSKAWSKQKHSRASISLFFRELSHSPDSMAVVEFTSQFSFGPMRVRWMWSVTLTGLSKTGHFVHVVISINLELPRELVKWKAQLRDGERDQTQITTSEPLWEK